MDYPPKALELYPKTAVLLLMNAPKGLRVGIDNTIWDVGEKFKGFKLIPPGAHFVHYTLHAEKHQFRIGFLLSTHAGEIIVKEWNDDIDTFIDMIDKEQAESKAKGIS